MSNYADNYLVGKMKGAVWSMATGRASTGAIDEVRNSKVIGTVDGPGDAYRNLLLSAELTRKFGENDARKILNFMRIWNAKSLVL